MSSRDEPDPAGGGASGRVRWQSRSSAASIGLHPRETRGIQAISNKINDICFFVNKGLIYS
ncbi:MAG: hypothetical protein NT039_00750 [Candidatus Berkelbacteria bacterium]|nr:hypothetical protein [Candidatus Berkelbacteria bacterium]